MDTNFLLNQIAALKAGSTNAFYDTATANTDIAVQQLPTRNGNAMTTPAITPSAYIAPPVTATSTAGGYTVPALTPTATYPSGSIPQQMTVSSEWSPTTYLALAGGLVAMAYGYRAWKQRARRAAP